ncbi:MAG: winged helix-turn-helix domain-containing protein [Janthinobacterium lividum]
MTDPQPDRRFRFGIFEADATTGELRRQGIRIKLNAQPFQVLLLLLERPGELLTREQITQELWPGDTFVDYEHGVNSAVNRIREALGDTASNPRFVQTLARRGYRFLAPVERIVAPEPLPALPPAAVSVMAAAVEPVMEPVIGPVVEPVIEPVIEPATESAVPVSAPEPAPRRSRHFLATAQDLPKVSPAIVQTLFLLLQLMYVGFYVGALANLTEIGDLFSPLPFANKAFLVTMMTAAMLIPVRAFLVCAVLFHAPGMQKQYRRLWPFLLPFDELWALSPFLLLHHINYGLALACTTLLVYSPFAQRSLVLMGAGAGPEANFPNAR